MNRRINLTESDLKNIVKTTIHEILKERDIDDDNYYGGGLPDNYIEDDSIEEPNYYEDFEGTPAWNAITKSLSEYGVGDFDFDTSDMYREICKKIGLLQNGFHEAFRDNPKLTHDDMIKYIEETLPNYRDLLKHIKFLYLKFKGMML